MASRKLRRMNLSDEGLVQKLQERRLTKASHVLSKTELELVRDLDAFPQDIRLLFSEVSRAICPQSKTALGLFHARNLSTLELLEGIPSLGVNPGFLVEIVGPAGVGKSQCCMMLAAQASREAAKKIANSQSQSQSQGDLEGCDGANSMTDEELQNLPSAIYIDTEGSFSALRFVEIAQQSYPEIYDEVDPREIAKRLFVFQEKSTDDLLKRIRSLDEHIVERNAKLVVIDSLAEVIRADFGARGSLAQRSAKLGEIASLLKQLAKNFDIPIVVTNQVTTRRDDDDGSVSLGAALGVTWAHAVNTRFILEDLGDTKRIKIAKSPEFAFDTFQYQITSAGLEQLPMDNPLMPLSQQRQNVLAMRITKVEET